ncbi:MAG: hypothetical protein ABIK09_18845 [Pseudomonadota bacterium]
MKQLPLILVVLVLAACSAVGDGGADASSVDGVLDVAGPPDLTVDAPRDTGTDAPVDLPDAPADDSAEDVPDALAADVPPPPEPVPFVDVSRDPWGGYSDLPVAAGTGWFTTALHDGRAWLVDPDGNAFFSLGIQAVAFGSLSGEGLGYQPGNLAQYAKYLGVVGSLGAIPAWVKSRQVDTMMEHGFNTLGGWSSGSEASGKMAYTRNLGFMSGCGGDAVPAVSAGGIRDVFHPDFAAGCLAYAAGAVSAGEAADPWFIGVYSDNELRWHGGDLFVPDPSGSLADDFIDEAAATPGKLAFAARMEDRYAGDLAAFNGAYGLELDTWDALLEVTALPFDPGNATHRADRDAFVEQIAEAYYSAVDAALDATVPEHLNLCDRIAEVAPLPVFRMAGKHCDVVTVNDYYIQSDPMIDFMLGAPPEERWEAQSAAAFEGAGGVKPFIVTEYGIRGADSGHPNTYGAGKTVPTQQDRAEFYEWSSRWFLERSHEGTGYVTGWHWFMYTDEPPTGRTFDPEDCNYGVVTLRDERYVFLLQAMAHVNRFVDGLLVAGVAATLLAPPPQIQWGVDEVGGVDLGWTALPFEEAWRVHVLTHPAGTDARIVGTREVDTASASVDLTGLGEGLFWIAVEPLHAGLLHLGARVVGPFEGVPAGGGAQADVLCGETLVAVRFENALPLPNTADGQTYATLAGSFTDCGEQALQLDFVPSSLAFVNPPDGQDGELGVTLLFPEPLIVEAAQALSFHLLPAVAVSPGNVVRPASDFIVVLALGEGEEPIAQWPLSAHVTAPAEAVQVFLPPPEPLTIHGLRFSMDLFEPGLPMEQVLTITVDGIAVL